MAGRTESSYPGVCARAPTGCLGAVGHTSFTFNAARSAARARDECFSQSKRRGPGQRRRFTEGRRIPIFLDHTLVQSFPESPSPCRNTMHSSWLPDRSPATSVFPNAPLMMRSPPLPPPPLQVHSVGSPVAPRVRRGSDARSSQGPARLHMHIEYGGTECSIHTRVAARPRGCLHTS